MSCVVHRARRGGSRRAGGGGDDGCLVSPWFLIVAVGFLAFCTAPLLVCVFPWVWTVRHALSLSPLLSPAPPPPTSQPVIHAPACVLSSPLPHPIPPHHISRYLSRSLASNVSTRIALYLYPRPSLRNSIPTLPSPHPRISLSLTSLLHLAFFLCHDDYRVPTSHAIVEQPHRNEYLPILSALFIFLSPTVCDLYVHVCFCPCGSLSCSVALNHGWASVI